MAENNEKKNHYQDKYHYEITPKRLILQDFRGFGFLSLDLEKDVTVLIAQNGGGKTTILDAIAEMLKIFVAYLTDRKYEDYTQLRKNDVKNGVLTAKADFEIELTYPIDVERYIPQEHSPEKDEVVIERDGTNMPLTLGFSLNLESGEVRPSINAYNVFEIEELLPFKESFKKYRDDENLPVLAYYGCHAISTDVLSSKNQNIRTRVQRIYDNALEPQRFSFSDFYDYFESKYKVSYTNKTSSNEINWISKAIETMLNDDIEKPTFKNLRMDYRGGGNDAMVIDKKNAEEQFEPLEIAQMSAGEKMLFALVADLAIRLIEANPSVEFYDKYGSQTSKTPLSEGKGLVLIDEVDLHLHPKWQQKVMIKLKNIFPNLQFIVTTHSPLIIQNSSGQVYEMKNGNFEPSQLMGGWSIEEILIKMGFQTINDLFGDSYLKHVDEFYKACDMSNIEEAKKNYDEILKYLPKSSSFRISLKNKLNGLTDNWL